MNADINERTEVYNVSYRAHKLHARFQVFKLHNVAAPHKRWRQLVAAKGEGEVRETAFAFWREVASGEDVANRGSALNARLGALPDQAQDEHETNKAKEK